MPRYKLTIEYAGTRYSGWQIQTNARTIQGELVRAVRTATGRDRFEVYGAGAIIASREAGWSGEDGWHYCPAHRDCHGTPPSVSVRTAPEN